MFELIVALVATIAGMVASVVGFGIGSLLTPTFAMKMDMRVAVAAVSIPHLAATAFRLWRIREHIDFGILKSFGILSAFGSLAGAILGALWTSEGLAIVLASLLLFVGVAGLMGVLDRMQFEGRMRWVAGLASGLFGGLVGNQGGVRSAALLGFDLQKLAFVATATASGVIVDLARMPVYAAVYYEELIARLPVIAIATAGCLVGTIIGQKALTRVPQVAFRTIVFVILIVTSMLVIARHIAT